jgi:GNAT superfamily N-acetyltransferase
MDYLWDSLNSENLAEVYALFQRNINFLSIPEIDFRRGSIEDAGFMSHLSIILRDSTSHTPIAAAVVVWRKGWVMGRSCFIKALVVDRSFQRKGIGSAVLKEIMIRAKPLFPWKAWIRFGDSAPSYWTPGVDLRHTSLVFFFKKHGFRQFSYHHNLLYDVSQITYTPKTEINGYTISRLTPAEFDSLTAFVKKEFGLGAWPAETSLSYPMNPIPTFIAKDNNGKIMGWASHSIDFPGTFGPTGVLKSLRGKGVGGELLKWCMYDMKHQGVKECVIRWVVGDTVKFYSKTLGAYIGQVFFPMAKRL